MLPWMVLNSNKVDRLHLSKKTLECETEGSELKEAYEEETKKEEVEPVEKKRKNLNPGGLSSKRRKINDMHYETKTGTDEEIVEEKGKKCKGKKLSWEQSVEELKP